MCVSVFRVPEVHFIKFGCVLFLVRFCVWLHFRDFWCVSEVHLYICLFPVFVEQVYILLCFLYLIVELVF